MSDINTNTLVDATTHLKEIDMVYRQLGGEKKKAKTIIEQHIEAQYLNSYIHRSQREERISPEFDFKGKDRNRQMMY